MAAGTASRVVSGWKVSAYLQPPLDKDLINSLRRAGPSPSVTCSLTLGKALRLPRVAAVGVRIRCPRWVAAMC